MIDLLIQLAVKLYILMIGLVKYMYYYYLSVSTTNLYDDNVVALSN
jgi:hypothetical protein